MPAKSFHPVTPAFLAIGLALSGLAAQADAQGLPPGCQPSNPNAPIEGALIGGAAGALLGSAIAGHHHKGDGAVVGGVGGAVVGAMVGSNSNQPSCPEGYAYVAPPQGPPGPPPPPAYAYPSAPPGDFWYGAPYDLRARFSFVRNQIARVDQDGWLSPRERGRLYHHLDEMAQQEDRMRYESGGYLGPDQVRRLTDELNDISRHVHWDEFIAEHPPRAY